VPETYIQIFDSSDVTLPPPPPPPVTEVAADGWGLPDPAAVADAFQQRNSAMYSATDYEVQEALSAPSITDGKHYLHSMKCRSYRPKRTEKIMNAHVSYATLVLFSGTKYNSYW